MTNPWTPKPEAPRAEPEIIPPGQPDPRDTRGRPPIWFSVNGRGRPRIIIARPGPLGGFLAWLILAGLTAMALLYQILLVSTHEPNRVSRWT
jgi:hypothetical protein